MKWTGSRVSLSFQLTLFHKIERHTHKAAMKKVFVLLCCSILFLSLFFVEDILGSVENVKVGHGLQIYFKSNSDTSFDTQIQELELFCEWSAKNRALPERCHCKYNRNKGKTAFASKTGVEIPAILVERLYTLSLPLVHYKSSVSKSQDSSGTYWEGPLGDFVRANLGNIVAHEFSRVRYSSAEKELLMRSVSEGVENVVWNNILKDYPMRIGSPVYALVFRFQNGRGIEIHCVPPLISQSSSGKFFAYRAEDEFTRILQQIVKNTRQIPQPPEPIDLNTVFRKAFQNTTLQIRQYLNFYSSAKRDVKFRPYFEQFELTKYPFPSRGLTTGPYWNDFKVEKFHFRDKTNPCLEFNIDVETPDFQRIGHVPDINDLKMLFARILKKPFVKEFLSPGGKIELWFGDGCVIYHPMCYFSNSRISLCCNYINERDVFSTWNVEYREKPEWLDIKASDIEVKSEPDDRKVLTIDERNRVIMIDDSGMLTTEKIQTETELVHPELDRMTAEEWYGKGATMQEKERKIECFSNAIRLSPRFADAYEARGNEFFDKDDYDMARKDYTRKIHLNPRSGNAFCNRGFAYGALGNYDKAIHDFDRAIRMEPENWHAYIYRGNCHGEKGDYMQALRDGIKAGRLAAGPHQDYPHNLKGKALLMLGQPDNATREFNEAIKLNPTDPENYCLRGLATAYKGNYEQALRDCNTGIQKGNGDSQLFELYVIRGEVYYHFKKYPEALADFEEYVKKETDAKKISAAKVKIARCKKRIRTKGKP